jgi:DNA-binding CsgD family transcriptional regulator
MQSEEQPIRDAMTYDAREGCDPRHSVSVGKAIHLSANCKEIESNMDSIPSMIVADFYDAGLDPARWPQALLALCEWVKADAVGLGFHDLDAGTGHFDRAIGIPAEAQASYRRLHGRSNPWFQSEAAFRSPATIVRGSEVADEAAVKASPFYRTWLKSTGLMFHLFVVLERRGGSLSYLMLARRQGKPDFGDDAISILQDLASPLCRAHSLTRRIVRLRALERAAVRAVNAMPIGVALLDRNGAVIEANATARAVIEVSDGLGMVNGGLGTDIAGRRVKLKDFIGRSTDRIGVVPADEVSLLPVPRASGQRPLTLLLAPLGEDPNAASVDTPAALLFIGDPERTTLFDQARIARLYGLSRAESRVAALLASGYRLEQVAEKLEIAYETVRKHLKQIFGKTGTYRQAELVRMLVTGPAGLSI